VAHALAGVSWSEVGAKCVGGISRGDATYVMRYLFASRGRAADSWLWVEVLGLLIFAALAILGVQRSPWFLAIGIVLHGITWDSWHYGRSAYMPDWYAFACFAVDLVLGAYVAHVFSRMKGHRALRPLLDSRLESNFCAECRVHLMSRLPSSIKNRRNRRD
jgi:hypothetical protein